MQLQGALGPPALTVTFDAGGSTASEGLASYTWDFGDGSPLQHDAAAAHTYRVPGSYQAELTVTDVYGRQATEKAMVTVTTPDGRVPPRARIVASAREGEGTLAVSFSCDCSPGDAPIVAYRWSLGGDVTSTEAAPARVFGPGRHRVQLTVFDAQGLPGYNSVEVVVSRAGELPPRCRLSAAPPAGPAPVDALYTADFHDPDGTVSAFAVTFEDGTRSEALETARTHPTPTQSSATPEGSPHLNAA